MSDGDRKRNLEGMWKYGSVLPVGERGSECLFSECVPAHL